MYQMSAHTDSLKSHAVVVLYIKKKNTSHHKSRRQNEIPFVLNKHVASVLCVRAQTYKLRFSI